MTFATARSRTRDPALDGRIFVGVTTPGSIAARSVPARTPKPENIRFFPSAAAAQEAGFRPCLRCRPEISPDAAAWRGTSNTVSRALALIGEGAARRRGRRGRAGGPARRRRAAAAPPVRPASGRAADRRGADAARAVRQAADPGHAAFDDRHRGGVGLRQRAALQRCVPQALSPRAERTAAQALPRRCPP